MTSLVQQLGFDPFDEAGRFRRRECRACADGRLVIERLNDRVVKVECDSCSFGRICDRGGDGQPRVVPPPEAKPDAAFSPKSPPSSPTPPPPTPPARPTPPPAPPNRTIGDVGGETNESKQRRAEWDLELKERHATRNADLQADLRRYVAELDEAHALLDDAEEGCNSEGQRARLRDRLAGLVRMAAAARTRSQPKTPPVDDPLAGFVPITGTDLLIGWLGEYATTVDRDGRVVAQVPAEVVDSLLSRVKEDACQAGPSKSTT